MRNMNKFQAPESCINQTDYQTILISKELNFYVSAPLILSVDCFTCHYMSFTHVTVILHSHNTKVLYSVSNLFSVFLTKYCNEDYFLRYTTTEIFQILHWIVFLAPHRFGITDDRMLESTSIEGVRWFGVYKEFHRKIISYCL